MDDNKIYNYLNQYDREVYIEGESEQQLDVINTVDFSNNKFVLAFVGFVWDAHNRVWSHHEM